MRGNCSFPLPARLTRRLLQIHDPGFRNKDPLGRSLPAWFESRGIPIEKRVETIRDFVNCFVFATECTQRHLRKVSGHKKRRPGKLQRIFEERRGIEISARQFIKQQSPGGLNFRRPILQQSFKKRGDGGHNDVVTVTPDEMCDTLISLQYD